MKKPILLLLALSAFRPGVNAQTPLPLNDLSAFKSPSKSWRIVGGLTGNPTAANFSTQPGSGVLLAQPGKTLYNPADNLQTVMEHGDLHLELDFMLPKGANSGVYLQGRYEVQLFDSWGIKTPNYGDAGGIYQRWDEKRGAGREGFEGFAPRQNASRAPGLWQHLSLDFEAPKFDASGRKTRNARFVRVLLNGTLLHENVELTGPTRSAISTDEKAIGPLMLQGDHGPVAFRDIRYERFEKGPLTTGPVQYRFYNGFSETIPGTFTKSPDVLGSAKTLNIKLAQNNQYVAAFDGTLTADVAGPYDFDLQHSEIGTLVVDGDTLLNRVWGDRRLIHATKNLTPGEHRYSVLLRKGQNWQKPALGLFVKRSEGYRQALHDPASVPQPEPTPLIAVQPGAEPELVRAFVYKPGFGRGDGNKKLRVLHVGDPSGVHYSYDLEQAALLDVWKGEFLNTTDAWYERGEAQTVQPLGTVLPLWGTTPVAVSTNAQNPNLPDSTAGIVFKSYRLDEAGHPTFRYQLGNLELVDRLTPYQAGRGLSREVTVNGGGAVVRIVWGKTIQSLGNNLYLVDGQYYVQMAQKANVVSANNRQELVATVTADASTVRYDLIW
ncbi:MAG: DUF1080 domain-containing protein [Cytophagaceae bacterium]|nr:DUF1080 domain-containing protein [Cytophagaceae bacterium]